MADLRPGNNFFSNRLMISSATTCFFASYSTLERPWNRKQEHVLYFDIYMYPQKNKTEGKGKRVVSY
jgi:hypothetical protein